MKKKFKNRKQLQVLAEKLGLEDQTVIAGVEDEITKKPRFELINNARRFVRGILKLPQSEQVSRINQLNAIIAEQELKDKA